MGSLVAHPLWHQCPIDNPVSLCPGFLPELPILTLSPSDPLSRWASSGQQPQQQHIPTWALPSSKPPWHCLALLSWRQTLPAPGLRLVRIGHRACSPGCLLQRRVNGGFGSLSYSFPGTLITLVSHVTTSQQDSPSPPHPILSTKKRAHSSIICNTHHPHSETVPA